METNNRSLLAMLLVMSLIAGAYFAYDLFTARNATPRPQADRTAEHHAKRGAATRPRNTPAKVDERARARQEKRVTLSTEDLVATFTNRNTALTNIRLLGKRFHNEPSGVEDLVTTDKEQYLPLRMELLGVNIPSDAFWKAEQVSPTTARFTWEGNGFRVVRKLEATRRSANQPPRYEIWSTVRIENLGHAPRPVRLRLTTHRYAKRDQEKHSLFAVQAPGVSHGVCLVGDDIVRGDREHLHGGQGHGPGVRFAGVENVYFASVLVAQGKPAERCQLSSSPRGGTPDEPDGTLFEARLIYPRTQVPANESTSFRTLMYVGPKFSESLHAANHGLTAVVDYGFFSAIARVLVDLLASIQKHVVSWGLAIILLTFLVKIALYPLTEKSFRSMARLRLLKPEMDRVNELYKDDREKKGAAMMELYRKHKINPLGGCLPQLVQLPIWWALYTSLSTNVELYHTHFALWWTDLSSPDPYFVLPAVLGVLMFVQQKITPSTMDPTQAKIMLYMMPAMITVFMLFLPAGLCLYMVTNSTLGIAQQQFIQHRLEKQVAAQAAADPIQEEEEPSETTLVRPEANSAKRAGVKGSKTRTRHRRQRRGRA